MSRIASQPIVSTFALVVLIATASVAAQYASGWLWASPLLVAFTIGVALSLLSPSNPRRHSAASIGPVALKFGVGLLGARVAWSDVSSAGPAMALASASIAVAGTLIAFAAARLLKIVKPEAAIVGAGCGICGASASLAAADALRGSRDAVSWVVAALTLFGLLAIPVIGALASATGMTPNQHAIWLGLALPEVAHVVLAAHAASTDNSSMAMLAKLLRVVALGPVIWLLALTNRTNRAEGVKQFLPPSYVIAFFALLGASALGFLPQQLAEALTWLSLIALTAAMAAIGLAFVTRRPRASEGLLVAATVIGLAVVVALAGGIAAHL